MPSGYDFMLLINETDYSVQIRLKSHNIKNRSLLQARVSLVAAILNVKYVVNRGQPQYGTRNDRELLETLLAVILFLQIRERSSNLNKIPVPSAKQRFFFILTAVQNTKYAFSRSMGPRNVRKQVGILSTI